MHKQWNIISRDFPGLERNPGIKIPIKMTRDPGTEPLDSPPSLTARDRKLVSAPEVRIELGDLNTRPLTPQSVTLPTLPRAGYECVLHELHFIAYHIS